MKDKTPLIIARAELRGMQELLAHVRKGTDKEKIAAVEKSVAAFKKLTTDPIALQRWWDSISAEGKKMMIDML